jgi:D-arginine dehydrogenase
VTPLDGAAFEFVTSGVNFDIAIIGGGIAGASLGAELGGRARAVILEAEDQCGYHSTGRSAAFFLESYGGEEVAKLNRASRPVLEGGSFLRQRGAIHLSAGDWPELPDEVPQRRLDRAELEQRIPGLREQWTRGLFEPGCADIDVAALHAAFLGDFRRAGGDVRCGARVVSASRPGGQWTVTLADGSEISAPVLVNAAGAWADTVAVSAGVAPIGLQPLRRTMAQLRVGRSGLRDLPLIIDWAGSFYFKGESDHSIWLSPHDEIACPPCDAAPEEVDVATAIYRFENVVDWPVEQVERRWAGLRTFAPDRLPIYGFDSAAEGFFWCAGQGGFGIQSSPAAARMAAALVLGEKLPPDLAEIRPEAFAPARFR